LAGIVTELLHENIEPAKKTKERREIGFIVLSVLLALLFKNLVVQVKDMKSLKAKQLLLGLM
jgi:hypothetical protein